MPTHLVLVVEDDADIRNSLREVLLDEGYDVDTAGDGREALQVLGGSRQPCLILLDLMMPVMDGVAFRKAQLDDAAIAGIPVIIVTAHGRVEEVTKSLLPAAFVAKPFELERLLAEVHRVCDARAAVAD